MLRPKPSNIVLQGNTPADLAVLERTWEGATDWGHTTYRGTVHCARRAMICEGTLSSTSECRTRMRCSLRSWKKRWRCRKLPGTCVLSSSSRVLLGFTTGANVRSWLPSALPTNTQPDTFKAQQAVSILVWAVACKADGYSWVLRGLRRHHMAILAGMLADRMFRCWESEG